MKKGHDGYKNEDGDSLSVGKDCGVSSSPDVLLQELKMSFFFLNSMIVKWVFNIQSFLSHTFVFYELFCLPVS